MRGTKNKIKTIAEVVKIARTAKKKGLKIVTENGCFDIIHAGHVKNLEWARAQGDMLIVGINSDASVKSSKEPMRPIVAAKERIHVIAGLEPVDYVFIFDTDSPIPWFRRIKPSVHVKGAGSEKDPRFAGEAAVVEKYGGKVVLAPNFKGRSTTNIVETILQRYCKPRTTTSCIRGKCKK